MLSTAHSGNREIMACSGVSAGSDLAIVPCVAMKKYFTEVGVVKKFFTEWLSLKKHFTWSAETVWSAERTWSGSRRSIWSAESSGP